MYTQSLDALIKSMNAKKFVRAKFIRRAIDNSEEVRNVLKLDGDALKTYNSFRVAVLATDKKESKIKFDGETYTRSMANKIINTVEGQGEAKDRLTYRQLSERSNALMGKLLKDFSDINELGHDDISILTAQIALLLKEMSSTDPRRAPLRALFIVAQEIDAITDPVNISFTSKGAKANLNTLINSASEILGSEYDITSDAAIVVDAFTGIEGEATFSLENREINQLKGRMAARLGSILKRVVEGSTNAFERNFADVNILGLKGSPNIQDRIETQITHILDPKIKGKPKKSTLKPKTGKGKVKKASVRRKKAKTSSLTVPIIALKTSKKKSNIKPSKVSIARLIPLINNILPETIERNMNKPYLESRTGRFSSSVRAVDATKTAKGYTSIGYTYQREPYGVYETTSGSRFASSDRDPRKIIDVSIREIAAQFGLGRLYTRRV